VDLTSAIVLKDKDVDGEVDAVIIGDITVEEVRKIINSINDESSAEIGYIECLKDKLPEGVKCISLIQEMWY
jgi:ACT domain-containing protein